jgi:hypothetical protein
VAVSVIVHCSTISKTTASYKYYVDSVLELGGGPDEWVLVVVCYCV